MSRKKKQPTPPPKPVEGNRTQVIEGKSFTIEGFKVYIGDCKFKYVAVYKNKRYEITEWWTDTSFPNCLYKIKEIE